jgi:hypothetical protein
MEKVAKIHDEAGHSPPLRITQRKAKGKKAASFRVGCGCCNEGLVIFPSSDDPRDTLIEINGVMGSRSQWQQIFGRLLEMEPKSAQ